MTAQPRPVLSLVGDDRGFGRRCPPLGAARASRRTSLMVRSTGDPTPSAPTPSSSISRRSAARVVADPAWPALVAAVSQATDSGWTAEQVLATAHGLLLSGGSHDPAGNDLAGPGTGTNPASPGRRS